MTGSIREPCRTVASAPPPATDFRAVASTTRPRSYRLAGLDITSDFALPEAALASPAVAHETLTIEDGDRLGLPRPPDGAGRTPDSTRIRFATPGVGRFVIEGGRRVIAWPDPGVEDGDLSQALLGPALALVLMQQGVLVLHGAVLVRDDRTLLLLGDSGMGKSTTAAACASAGYAVLSDDLAIVDCASGAPFVRAVASLVRVGPASPLLPSGVPAWTTAGKIVQATAPDGRDRGAWPLGACVILDWDDTTRVTRLGPVEAALGLLDVAFCRTAFGPTEAAAALRQCTLVANTCEVASLVRPRGPYGLASAVAALGTVHERVRP